MAARHEQVYADLGNGCVCLERANRMCRPRWRGFRHPRCGGYGGRAGHDDDHKHDTGYGFGDYGKRGRVYRCDRHPPCNGGITCFRPEYSG